MTRTKRRTKQTTGAILSAAENPALLEIYADILNPAKKNAKPASRGYTLVHQVPRPNQPAGVSVISHDAAGNVLTHEIHVEEPVLSTTAMKNRKQISEPKTEEDRLTNTAKSATQSPAQSISVDGISGSAEALVKSLEQLYNHCTQIASQFGVQTKDITAKLDAMASGTP